MFFRSFGPSSPHRLMRPQPRPALPRPLGPGGRSLLRAAAALGTSPRVCALPARTGLVRAGLANPGDGRGGEAVVPLWWLGERSAPARPTRSRQPGQSLHGYPRGSGRRRAGRKRPHSMQPPVPMRHTCCGRSRRARAGLRPAARPGPASEEHNGRRLRGWAVGVGVLGGTDGETLPCDSVWNGSLESAGGGEAAGPPSAAGPGPGRGLPQPGQVGGVSERCRRAEPRRPPGPIYPTPKPAPPGCRGSAARGPPGSPRARAPQASKGSRGESPRPLLRFQANKGREEPHAASSGGSAPPLMLRPLCLGPAGVTLQVPGRGREPCPGAVLPFLAHPVTRHCGARLHSACGPCAASDQPPLLAAQHPGGIAIARNGRTRSRPLSVTTVQYHFQNVKFCTRIALLNPANGFKYITSVLNLCYEHTV